MATVWTTKRNYLKGQLVYNSQDDSFYQAKQDHASNAITEPPNKDYWILMVESNPTSTTNSTANATTNATTNAKNNPGNLLPLNGIGIGIGSGNGSGIGVKNSGNVGAKAPENTNTGKNVGNGANPPSFIESNQFVNTIVIVLLGAFVVFGLFYIVNYFFKPATPGLTAGPAQRAERAIETLVTETNYGQEILKKMKGTGATVKEKLKYLEEYSNETGNSFKALIDNNIKQSFYEKIENISIPDAIKALDNSSELIKTYRDNLLKQIETNIKDLTHNVQKAIKSKVQATKTLNQGFDVETNFGGRGYGGSLFGGYGGQMGSFGNNF